MTLLVKDIPEVPSWVAMSGDNTDTWFYQQLAKFASEKLAAQGALVIAGEAPLNTTPVTVTMVSEPKMYMFICPDNINNSGSFFRMVGEAVGFLASCETGPVYKLSVITSNLIGSQKTQNADGTWTLSMVNNSTTDPDYYAIFVQA